MTCNPVKNMCVKSIPFGDTNAPYLHALDELGFTI